MSPVSNVPTVSIMTTVSFVALAPNEYIWDRDSEIISWNFYNLKQ